jgi:hypothetical protein
MEEHLVKIQEIKLIKQRFQDPAHINIKMLFLNMEVKNNQVMDLVQEFK